jgi:DNA modification methylase
MTTKTHNPADKVERWSIDKLTPYARNSRTHSDEQISQLAASIKEWGWTTPVLVDEDGSIIAGHGRTLAAQRLKMTEVPVMVAKGWSDAKKRAYVIADNKLAMNAGWDNEMLALEFSELQGMDFDLDLTGFTADEIAALMPEEIEPGKTDEDAVPEVPEQPVTVLGDVWILGKHRLMCGDSTSIDAVDKLMDGQKADMVFTDPPYGMAYESNAWDSKKKDVKAKRTDAMILNDDTTAVGKDALNLLPAVTKNECHFYIWCRWDCFHDFLTVAQGIATVKGVVVWDKGGPGLGDLQCSYGDSEWAIHALRGRKPLAERQNGVWQVNRMKGLQMVHPTQKPVELCERAISNSSLTKELVLDLFGGSGSTLIACEKTNRQARLMELDPKYCDVIVKRWQDYTGKKATHAETGKTFDEVHHGN